MTSVEELSQEQLKRCLDEAVAAAQEAGNLMLECFARNDAQSFVEEKANPTDLVTKYDRQVEDLVLGRLRSAFPDFKVVAEETASDEPLTDAPTWVVDPIDGTTNFIHRQAECCVLIGLTIHRKAILGVCFIPKLDEMFTAVRGQGAYCNGRRIRVSSCQDLKQAMVNTHFMSYSRGGKVVDRWHLPLGCLCRFCDCRGSWRCLCRHFGRLFRPIFSPSARCGFTCAGRGVGDMLEEACLRIP